MNGTGLYPDWVKKAKFLGIERLGIVEKATLAGALKFQTLEGRRDYPRVWTGSPGKG